MRPSYVRFVVAAPLLIAFAQSLFADAAPERTAVPTEAAQTAAMKLIKEVYGNQYQHAKSTAEQRALAKTLLGKAKETNDDLASKFTLLRLARDIARQAGDVETAFQAIDAMAMSFEVDVLELKCEVLKKLASSAQKPAQHRSVAEEALNQIDRAVSQDRFDTAADLNELTVNEANKANDPVFLTEANSRVGEAAEIAKAYDAAKGAKAALSKTPDDPEANAIVGKYHCFFKGDWDKGLPMLIRGSDEAAKELASDDIHGAVLSAEQVKLGDKWWDLAQTQHEAAKKQILGRARLWYQKALPGLSGLTKDRVEKRIGEIDARAFPRGVSLSSLRIVEADVRGTQRLPRYAAKVSGVNADECIWSHPPAPNRSAHVGFQLDGEFRLLAGAIGLDEVEIGRQGTTVSPLTWRIVGDDKVLWRSKPIKKAGVIQHFRVSVEGVKKLDLVATAAARYRALRRPPILTDNNEFLNA